MFVKISGRIPGKDALGKGEFTCLLLTILDETTFRAFEVSLTTLVQYNETRWREHTPS